jgi:hypothetical protein
MTDKPFNPNTRRKDTSCLCPKKTVNKQVVSYIGAIDNNYRTPPKPLNTTSLTPLMPSCRKAPAVTKTVAIG